MTPGLTEWYASGDTEELEWAATILAARESLGLLAADPSADARRVVLAIDCEQDEVIKGSDEGHDRGRVELKAPVQWRNVAAALVDAPEARDDVTKARTAWSAAAAGDEDASFEVDNVEGHDLMWFATQELQYLVGSDEA